MKKFNLHYVLLVMTLILVGCSSSNKNTKVNENKESFNSASFTAEESTPSPRDISKLVMTGDKKELQKLLEEGLNPNSSCYSTSDGELSCLSFTMNNRQYDLMKLILSYGANPDKKDSESVTPLYHAVTNGDITATKILLEHNADKSITFDGNDLITIATQLGYEKVVDALREGEFNKENSSILDYSFQPNDGSGGYGEIQVTYKKNGKSKTALFEGKATTFEDINHDGTTEIINQVYLDSELANAFAPIWIDLYHFDIGSEKLKLVSGMDYKDYYLSSFIPKIKAVLSKSEDPIKIKEYKAIEQIARDLIDGNFIPDETGKKVNRRFQQLKAEYTDLSKSIINKDSFLNIEKTNGYYSIGGITLGLSKDEVLSRLGQAKKESIYENENIGSLSWGVWKENGEIIWEFTASYDLITSEITHLLLAIPNESFAQTKNELGTPEFIKKLSKEEYYFIKDTENVLTINPPPFEDSLIFIKVKKADTSFYSQLKKHSYKTMSKMSVDEYWNRFNHLTGYNIKKSHFTASPDIYNPNINYYYTSLGDDILLIYEGEDMMKGVSLAKKGHQFTDKYSFLVAALIFTSHTDTTIEDKVSNQLFNPYTQGSTYSEAHFDDLSFEFNESKIGYDFSIDVIGN